MPGFSWSVLCHRLLYCLPFLVVSVKGACTWSAQSNTNVNAGDFNTGVTDLDGCKAACGDGCVAVTFSVDYFFPCKTFTTLPTDNQFEISSDYTCCTYYTKTCVDDEATTDTGATTDTTTVPITNAPEQSTTAVPETTTTASTAQTTTEPETTTMEVTTTSITDQSTTAVTEATTTASTAQTTTEPATTTMEVTTTSITDTPQLSTESTPQVTEASTVSSTDQTSTDSTSTVTEADTMSSSDSSTEASSSAPSSAPETTTITSTTDKGKKKSSALSPGIDQTTLAVLVPIIIVLVGFTTVAAYFARKRYIASKRRLHPYKDGGQRDVQDRYHKSSSEKQQRETTHM